MNEGAPMNAPLITMHNIVKVYPPTVLALDRADLTVREGEIHSVIGENGAGKSTLMHVLYGTVPANGGETTLRGQAVKFAAPREAVRAGIGMVHQEFMLIPCYTVYENVILGAEPKTKFGFLDRRTACERVSGYIEEYDLDLDPRARVEDLSVAAQQKVEILKLLYREVTLLIFDEPTAVLTPQEIKALFRRLRVMKQDGKTIVFISHKLDEVLELSDTITVMRKGTRIATLENEGVTKSDLARAMVGRDVVFSIAKTAARPKATILSLRNIVEAAGARRPRLNDLSLEVRAGEIVGVAGVEGNGRFELVQVLTGCIRVAKGRILLEGTDITDTDTPDRRGRFGFVPQNRKTEGSSRTSSLIDNAIMTHHRNNERFSGRIRGVLSAHVSRAFTEELIDAFGVVAPGPQATIGSLSGGNQQKVIVGRESLLNRPFLLLDQPTRGLDVWSIESIRQSVIQRRDEGAACLLISADLDELLSLSDRIVVLYRGRVVADLDPRQTTKEEIGAYMLGVKGGDAE